MRPSAQPIYEATNLWREAVIQGRSLFSEEPLDYREATAGLVNDFIKQPIEGGGSFTEKLEKQLAHSSDSAVQLASELLFLYCLPMHESSMGQATKVDLINTVASWWESVTPLPMALQSALLTGIARVGTDYQTYRWKIFEYLIRFTKALADLSAADRHSVLEFHDQFQAFVTEIDEQSVWSVRYLIEHLLFPDEAVASSSREDRVAMVAAFGTQAKTGDVNRILKELRPNIRYNTVSEINPYASPHRYEWSDLGEERTVWGQWGALVLEDQDEVDSEVTDDRNDVVANLKLLQTNASGTLLEWRTKNPSAVDDIVSQLETMGLAFTIQKLSDSVSWEGGSSEFVEAATALLGSGAAGVPQLSRQLIPLLKNQLGNIGISTDPSPGELTIGILEAIDVFGVVLNRSKGVEMNHADLAALAQQMLDLDPAETSWDHHNQKRFLDWRSGRGAFGPIEDPDKPGEDEDGAGIPQTMADLARELTFDTEDGRKWLETTRRLLHDRGQIILQGPPGTGKTFIAQRLALFLAKSSRRVKVVQFHPATAYEDFIEGLRPALDGKGGFELRQGPLLKLADQARQNPHEQHILIIDEINRANLPAVFGELYFLLEYRDKPIDLTYGRRVSLPENLLIIGTMNTADRSIASIDAALRRRFYICDLRPERAPLKETLPKWLKKNTEDLGWLALLLEIANEQIGDPDQHIGPSHFFKEKLTEERARDAWEFTVLPTLREHFYGQDERLSDFGFDALKSSALKKSGDVEAL